jgi:hypothetical protein
MVTITGADTQYASRLISVLLTCCIFITDRTHCTVNLFCVVHKTSERHTDYGQYTLSEEEATNNWRHTMFGMFERTRFERRLRFCK